MEAADLDPNPLVQIAAWLGEARAAGIVNAEAMALATADADGWPSVRMVLLKGCGAEGLTFFTNRESRKAVELAVRPRCAAALYWQPLDRQVRVEGTVTPLSVAVAQAYFDTRPRGSRIAAWASPQSQPVEDRASLERRVTETEERFAAVVDPPLPPHWGGYLVTPEVVELWQSRPNRLHDRLRYRRAGDVWQVERLAP